ncbi:MAG TPA: hypothetical protein VIL18_01125 [Longimicrobiales bacterium]
MSTTATLDAREPQTRSAPKRPADSDVNAPAPEKVRRIVGRVARTIGTLADLVNQSDLPRRVRLDDLGAAAVAARRELEELYDESGGRAWPAYEDVVIDASSLLAAVAAAVAMALADGEASPYELSTNAYVDAAQEAAWTLADRYGGFTEYGTDADAAWAADANGGGR